MKSEMRGRHCPERECLVSENGLGESDRSRGHSVLGVYDPTTGCQHYQGGDNAASQNWHSLSGFVDGIGDGKAFFGLDDIK